MREQQSQASSAEQIIEESQLDVARLRYEYLKQHARAGSVRDALIAEFHAAVINYYFALRPYRDSDSIGDRWDSAKLWKENGGLVRGFDQLWDWADKVQQVTLETSERGKASQVDAAPGQLPPKTLLRVSTALDDMARLLGIAVSVDDGPRPARLLDRQDPSDERLDIEANDGD
jgi:hypothetical protein